ncbi:hypothetical protein DFQ11_10257 [Winogradskyella epiphytica]|uniref:Deoxyribose-phosphate aldolase n=1 Tax=Winogradskyella epiphytica TaxID=262005 RepID=A0A2V4XF35_9FLAO|nr:DUF6503 family protein [Winogradskyella epiphytica]PYE81484.1 hypothetical protein DFQ11_10257 [Winogradskyella epiphytica]GGW64834.1 hypothetical protein GCM10008085_16080 [Winogradskyella epiphytica]
MKNLLILSLIVLLSSCKNENSKVVKPEVKSETISLSANDIVNKSIEVSGGDRFTRSSLKFEFRDTYYQALRKNHEFLLVRILAKDGDSIFDMLSNVGFERYHNEEFVKLEDSIANRYSASVNSVHYFSVLPYGLNDKAVNKTLLGYETIKGKDYHKIQVTFDEEGGGEDYDDVFVYWIDKEGFKVDYLAYSYKEKDGLGMRFREAYNERYVNGLRFVDYNNFKTEDKTISLEELGQTFEANKLDLLSKIVLENVQVELVNL